MKVWSGLRQIFELKLFWNFFLNFIAFNLTPNKLTAIKLTSILFVSITSSFAITKPNSALTSSCFRFSTPWSLQYWGEWCSYPIESLDKSLIKVGEFKEHLDVSYWLGLRPLFNSLNSFVLHADAFQGYHIAEEPNLFLMKLTLLQVGKQQKLPELL